jgi:hypothetical protein
MKIEGRTFIISGGLVALSHAGLHLEADINKTARPAWERRAWRRYAGMADTRPS